MKRQNIYSDNRHSVYSTRSPMISTSQSYRGNLMGHTHSIQQDYNKDRRYYIPSGYRGYNKQRDYIGRNEQYVHRNYMQPHNNLSMRKSAANPHYYYKSHAESDHYQLPVSHYYSEPSLTDVTSYESEISYRESLISVASSFDDLDDRVQTHNRKQQKHHRCPYPYLSDTEDRHAHHVCSLYSSDNQKKRHSDMERETHQQKDTRLNRRHTDKTFSAPRSINNTNNNQELSFSIYNANLSSDNTGNNSVPLIMFRKDETEDSSNSDIVYIPVVVLPEKNTSNDSNTECERVDNEQSFTKRNYVIQHNVAKDTIIENDETLSDNPDPRIVYRKVKDDNLFTENECPLLNNTAGMKRIQDVYDFDAKTMPIVNDINRKKACNETVTNKHFLHFNGSEIEKLQDIIRHSDNENISMSDPFSIPVMVAEFNTVTNPFSNPVRNIKPKLTPSTSRFNGTNRKKSVVQQSQSVQVSSNCVSKRKDGEVQTSEINLPTLLTANEEIIPNKLKEERLCINSDVTLPKDEKVKKHNSSKGNEIMTRSSNNKSEGKQKEIIRETNNLINKISKEEHELSKKNNEECNGCENEICIKGSTSSRQCKNKINNTKSQSAKKNLIIGTDYREIPKNMNSPYFHQDSNEPPFKRLFSNDYKMTSNPTYFPTGMYTDNPSAIENTYKWLTEPNRGFIESTSSSFATIPKQNKNVQAAYPCLAKLKKKIFSKDKLIGKKDDKLATKIDEKQSQEQAKAEGKATEEGDDKATEKREETKSKQQTEVNLSVLWDYIIQGFNLYLGKTVHTVLIDGIYTFGTVTEKLQKIRN